MLAAFIPAKAFRDLRLVTHYRDKLKGVIASEVNRMHKVLNDAGIRLSLVFSDIQCASAQAIIAGLIKDETIATLITRLKGRLLETIREHIDYLLNQCKKLDKEIFAAMNLVS